MFSGLRLRARLFIYFTFATLNLRIFRRWKFTIVLSLDNCFYIRVNCFVYTNSPTSQPPSLPPLHLPIVRVISNHFISCWLFSLLYLRSATISIHPYIVHWFIHSPGCRFLHQKNPFAIQENIYRKICIIFTDINEFALYNVAINNGFIRRNSLSIDFKCVHLWWEIYTQINKYDLVCNALIFFDLFFHLFFCRTVYQFAEFCSHSWQKACIYCT